MGRLDEQVIIVTGASAGIGRATALRLAREGATLVVTARRAERLEGLGRDIEDAGGKALVIPGDVNAPQDRERLVNETLSKFGCIDVLVNNAGYGQRGPIEIVPLEMIRRNFETNLFSLIALTQLVIPVMRRQGSGRIVNISSVAGKIARPLSSIYDATKHALEAVSDGLRSELAPFGIKVIVIQPGFILSEFFEVANDTAKPVFRASEEYGDFIRGFQAGYQRLKRIAGSPEDIAQVIAGALMSGRPRNRYAAPRHARLFLAMKRWLPERMFDAFLRKQTAPSTSQAPAPKEVES